MLWEARQLCTPEIVPVFRNTRPAQLPCSRLSRTRPLAESRTRIPQRSAKAVLSSDREVGLWRVAHVEAGVMAAVTRVVLEPAVRGVEGSDAVAPVVRRHVVVRAGPVRVGEDDANPRESPVS